MHIHKYTRTHIHIYIYMCMYVCLYIHIVLTMFCLFADPPTSSDKHNTAFSAYDNHKKAQVQEMT